MRVHVHIGRIAHHRFGGKEGKLESLRNIKVCHRCPRRFEAKARRISGECAIGHNRYRCARDQGRNVLRKLVHV